MKETWKYLPTSSMRYKISSLGRVKSCKSNKEKIINGSISNRGYRQYSIYIDKKLIVFCGHQLVAMAFLGHKPNGHILVVDHIDNDPLNNHVDNLQLITNRQNSTKDKKGYSSNYIGVYLLNNKWGSSIWVDGASLYLGCFDDEIEASDCYQSALKILHLFNGDRTEFKLLVKTKKPLYVNTEV